jgi:hypothetical protein
MTSNYQDKYLKYKIKYLELKNNLKGGEITGGGIIKDWIPQFIKNEICHNDTLIISTGDISDVDGFIALAEYAKSGADVVFIMNYPAYLNDNSETIKVNGNGLGYSYNGKEAIYRTLGFEQIISEAEIEVQNIELTKQTEEEKKKIIEDLNNKKKKYDEYNQLIDNKNIKYRICLTLSLTIK